MLSQPRRTPPPNMPPPGFFPVVPLPMLPLIPSEALNWNLGHATRQPTTVSYLPNYAEPDGEDDNCDDPVCNFSSAMTAPSAVEYLPNYISPSTIEYLPNYNEELPDDDEEYDDDDDMSDGLIDEDTPPEGISPGLGRSGSSQVFYAANYIEPDEQQQVL